MGRSENNMPARRKWTKKKILSELKGEKNLSWSGLRKNNPDLLSACEKGFGCFRKAVEALGLDYDEVRVIKGPSPRNGSSERSTLSLLPEILSPVSTQLTVL